MKPKKPKVEMKTREHENVSGIMSCPFVVDSDWYRRETEIASSEPEELLGAKLGALLPRHKNRDLCDLRQGLEQLALDPERLVAGFEHCVALEAMVRWTCADPWLIARERLRLMTE